MRNQDARLEIRLPHELRERFLRQVQRQGYGTHASVIRSLVAAWTAEQERNE